MIRLLFYIVLFICCFSAIALHAQTVLDISLVKKISNSEIAYYTHLKTEQKLSGDYKLIADDNEYQLANFDDGVLNGPYKVYKEDIKIIDGYFKHGEKHGVWLLYKEPWGNNAAGYLEYRQEYDQGKPHGQWVTYLNNTYTFERAQPVPASETEYDQGGKVLQTKYYDNGNIKSITHFKEGIRHGVYKEYYITGNQYSEIFYKDGQKNGETTVWHENGNVAKKGQYDDEGNATGKWGSWSEGNTYTGFANYISGTQAGDFELYYSNGQLKEKGEYDNKGNMAHVGRYQRYYKNGKKAEEIFYDKEGFKQDKALTWYENGNIKQIIYYKNDVVYKTKKRYFENGQLHETISYSKTEHVKDEWGEHRNFAKEGSYKRYAEDGNLLEEGNFKHNKRQGEWRFYHNGQLRRIENYKDGLNKGLYTLYHDGRLRETGNYIIVTDKYGHKYQKKDGLWTEYYYEKYYAPGTKQQETRWKAGQKDGVTKRYDKHGKLREEDVYENGRSVKRIQY